MRCLKVKQGIHLVLFLNIQMLVCNRCSTKISNLLQLYKGSKLDRYKLQLEQMMIHAQGFKKGGDKLYPTFQQ